MSGTKRAAKSGAKSGAKRGANDGAAATRAKAPTKVPTKAAAKAVSKVAVAAKRTAAKRPAPQTAPVRRAGEPAERMVLTGRGGARVWGTKHPAAQLTERQVIRFRRLVRDGKATVGELAAQEGCGHSRISMAVRGQTWAHLNEVAPPVG